MHTEGIKHEAKETMELTGLKTRRQIWNKHITQDRKERKPWFI